MDAHVDAREKSFRNVLFKSRDDPCIPMDGMANSSRLTQGLLVE